MFGPRFKDEYLIGFIIGGELATQVGAGTRAGYAALDAVYHQYRYVFCTPDCDSVWRQIVWLSTMEAWYSDANIDDWFIGQCNKSVLDGKPQEVIAGLHQGIGETWGNYMFNSPMYYSIHPDLRPEHYQGVDYEYVAYDEEYTDLGRGFIVMTNAQKRACGSCLGWTASTPTPEP